MGLAEVCAKYAAWREHGPVVHLSSGPSSLSQILENGPDDGSPALARRLLVRPLVKV